MSDFQTKMHQIQFRLGLHPDLLTGFKELTSKGRQGKGLEIEWRERQRPEGRGREAVTGKERGGASKGWFTPHVRNPEKYPDGFLADMVVSYCQVGMAAGC